MEVPPGYTWIIPAGAGKSMLLCDVVTTARDHPRGCGEEPARLDALWLSAGSSPRVRGRAVLRRAGTPCQRIIPAGAGKSGSVGVPWSGA